jgi:Mn2+/Fe2+ NRAMP family transporter
MEVEIRQPPHKWGSILRQLGPGLIIAGSIVGSGELVATTKTGAEAGFALIWLVLLGCLVKVFVQVELGRYSVIQGRTTMDGLNEVPGPRARVNWILWYWLVMFVVSLFQLGGIVGGVGQALAIAIPLTEEGRAFNEHQDREVRLAVEKALWERSGGDGEPLFAEPGPAPATAHDDVLWASLVTALTTLMLVGGRYRLVQGVSTVLVAGFTAVCIVNLALLQAFPQWRISLEDLLSGLRFQLPGSSALPGSTPLTTALAAFGIIGVGATELIQYPYWCLEKGYSRWAGRRENTEAWAARARGWLRVMQVDAWCSALVYTFATIAFYLLGAAVLGRAGLNPAGQSMVRTLSEMFVPVFGPAAKWVFLAGAFTVLYSTFFVSNASHARVCADAMRVFGLSRGGEVARVFWVKLFCGLFPPFCLVVYLFIRAPVALILASGIMQAIMLPMLGGAALYFRYRRMDHRLRPGVLWDAALWFSFLALLVVALWTLSLPLGVW